ncbi:AraC family transcriptional regulator ligand-binding domain-containing protein [Pendulispora albinea]|uniref:AraC family transcriptional regulator n=1 Tax=Pendulispora albinea TaxID=2741071 RepID=A0ABZ2LKQ9_9BACT
MSHRVSHQPTPCLPLLMAWMHANGASALIDRVQREFEIPSPSTGLFQEDAVPLETYRSAVDVAAKEMGDDFLGLRVAREGRRGCFGIAELAARSSPNAADALERVKRYRRLIVARPVDLDVQRADGEIFVAHFIPGDERCVGRQGNEFALGSILRVIRELVGEPIRAMYVKFAHTAPKDISPLQGYFGTTDLHFESRQNVIAFQEGVLSLPVVSSDASLLPWLDECAERILPRQPLGTKTVQTMSRLHQQIEDSLRAEQSARLERVARRLQCSARTLQRQLAEAGTSFQCVLDEVRRELAIDYLRDPERSIYEIALALGYSDLSSFHRAFVKWNGATPKSFRRALANTGQRPTNGRVARRSRG